MNFQPKIGFLFASQTFCGNIFSAFFIKITNLEENPLNKRSKVGTGKSLVSRTEKSFVHDQGPN